MKIYILIIWVFTLSSCNTKTKKIKKELVSKKLFKSEIKNSLHSPFGEATVNLPYGSKIVSEYKFPKEWKYISIFSDDYNPNKLDGNSKKINYLDSIFNSKHSLNKNWIINYKIDTTNYDADMKTVYRNTVSSNFRFVEVLPNIENVAVILRSYYDEDEGIHIVDLFTINQLGKVIDNINIYYSLSGDLHTSYKFFYIDKLYKITIKKFEVYEDQTNLISNEQYTILKTGKIIKKEIITINSLQSKLKDSIKLIDNNRAIIFKKHPILEDIYNQKLIGMIETEEKTNNQFKKYSFDFTAACYSSDYASIFIDSTKNKMYFYSYWDSFPFKNNKNFRELDLIKIDSSNKNTLVIRCKDVNNKEIDIKFIKIKGLPLYKFTFKGNLDLEKLEIKTNQFYTTESKIKKFSPVDCGDFDG